MIRRKLEPSAGQVPYDTRQKLSNEDADIVRGVFWDSQQAIAHSFGVAPFPISGFRQVLAVFINVLFVLDKLVLELLFQIDALTAGLRQAVNGVHNQVEAVQIVQHRHVKGRGDGAFFLVAANVEAATLDQSKLLCHALAGLAVARRLSPHASGLAQNLCRATSGGRTENHNQILMSSLPASQGFGRVTPDSISKVSTLIMVMWNMTFFRPRNSTVPMNHQL
jgi:hypothetical protein